MNHTLTPAEAQALQDAIDGLDTAMVWLEADLRRLERSLEAGIEIPTLGAMYAAMRRYGD
jgi:hypothetical protein